jgi:hypothetical protein
MMPKRAKDVGNTCQWFLESPEYTDWVGQGSSTLICRGKGAAPLEISLTRLLAGAGKSHLVFDSPLSGSDASVPSFLIGSW